MGASQGGAFRPTGQGAPQGPPPGFTYAPGQTAMHPPVLKKISEVGGVYVTGSGYGALTAPRLLKGATINQSGQLVTPKPAGPVVEPIATGVPIDVSQGLVPTDVSGIPQQSAGDKIEAIRQQFLVSQGLQPAGANLVNLLAQQQAERFSPNIDTIRQRFLTG